MQNLNNRNQQSDCWKEIFLRLASLLDMEWSFYGDCLIRAWVVIGVTVDGFNHHNDNPSLDFDACATINKCLCHSNTSNFFIVWFLYVWINKYRLSEGDLHCKTKKSFHIARLDEISNSENRKNWLKDNLLQMGTKQSLHHLQDLSSETNHKKNF